jgi:TATA-box binding protein (TBP) (component of TFIID and TFIIIB)
MLLAISRITHSSPRRPRYEPEVFPGVIFSMKEPKVTVLIFVSGRFAARIKPAR